MNIYAIKHLVQEVALHLLPSVDDPRVAEQNAWWLLEKLTGSFASELIADDMIIISQEQEELLQEWVRQRVEDKKPLQYILGFVPFCNLDIYVEPPILIPRPETEEIVAWLINKMKQQGVNSFDALDLCTGSGCIALALAKTFSKSSVVGLDINAEAIKLAEKNKKINMVSNASFIISNLYQQLDEHKKFDLIVSNPPYLSSASYTKVSDEIRLWEDPRALLADYNGMDLYEKIVHDVMRYIKQPLAPTITPQLVLEIGIDQQDIESLIKKVGFKRVESFNDMSGMRRWIAAWLK